MRYKVFGIIFSSLLSPIAVLTVGVTLLVTPVKAQDAPAPEAATAEVVKPAPPGDPKAATTTKDATIPVDELTLLVKPLTLDELNNEAAGWLLLLKTKVKAISDAEIAVKRLNQSIDKQKEAAEAAKQSKELMKLAQEALSSATPNSPEYAAASKQLEEAKASLDKAQKAVEAAKQAKEELEKYGALRDSVESAKESEELTKAQKALETAKEVEAKILEQSPSYKNEDTAQKIDALKKAIENFEKLQAEQKKVQEDSPEFQELKQKISEATQPLIQAREAIEGKTQSSDSTKKSAEELKKAENKLKDTEVKKETTGGQTDTVKEKEALEDKIKTLDIASQKLTENADFESKLKNQLVADVTQLQSDRTAVVDRFNVVLEEVKRKGGDIKSYQEYIEAIGIVLIDVKDSEGIGVRLLSWIKSGEGGVRWGINLAKFFGIILASVIVSQILGMILNYTLKILSRQTSKTLRHFLAMLVKRGGIVVGVLLALTALEISVGPILALAGGVSFVLAFALQSNLGNFASGLTLMLYKPFDIGDEIKINGIWGYVDSISLPSTMIKGFQGQMFTIPNNTVWSSTIENLTYSEKRQLAFSLRIGFNENLKKVEDLMLETIKSHPKVLQDPPPSTIVSSIEDYYISVGVSGWTKKDEFWDVYPEIIKMLKERFDKEGIRMAAIPEQQDINEMSAKQVEIVSHILEKSGEHTELLIDN